MNKGMDAVPGNRNWNSSSSCSILLLCWWFLIGLAGCDKTVVGSDAEPRHTGVAGTGNAARLIGQLIKDSQPISGTGFTARLLRLDGSGGLDLVKTASVADTGGFAFDSLITAEYVVEIWKDSVLRGKSGRIPLVDTVDLHIFVAIVDAVDRRSIDLEQLGGVDSVYVDYRENIGIRSDKKWLVQTLRDTGFVVYTYLSSPRNRWEAWYYLVRNGRVVLVNVIDGQLYANSWATDSSGYKLGPKVVALWDFDSIQDDGIVHDRSMHGNDLFLPPSFQSIRGRSGGGVRLNGDSGATTGKVGDDEFRRGGNGQRTYEIRFRIDSIPEGEVMICAGDPSMILVRDENKKLLIRGEVRNASGNQDVFLLFSRSDVPAGEWVDLAVSIDESKSELYAWMNGASLPLYAAQGWIGRTGIYTGFDDTFEVGTSRWYSAKGWISVDELRISDTLVYGVGKAVQLPQELFASLGTDGSKLLALEFADSGEQPRKPMETAFIGLDSVNGSVHRLAVRPTVPSELVGKELIAAWLEGWDTANISLGSLRLHVCSLNQDWSDQGVVSDWAKDPQEGTQSGASGCTNGRIVDGDAGFFRIDVTDLIQMWNSKSEPNYGFLLRAVDEQHTDGKAIFISPTDPTYRLGIRYLYR